ncbi:MAG: GIY-YIG nuclease family protein [Alteromonas stellipolaris]|uniref:GIY-YIG nuclease family protein n=1 Tax=Alteromonas TaxID=226 RepID=UPI00366C1C40
MGDIRSISKITEKSQKFSYLAWPILVEAAKTNSTIDGYSELAREVDKRNPGAGAVTGGEHHTVNRWLHCIHKMLEHIDPNIPKIGLLVRTSKGEFGKGLVKSLKDPDKVLQDIYAYPWDSIEYKVYPSVVKGFKGKTLQKKEALKAKHKAEKKRLQNSPKEAKKKLKKAIKEQSLESDIKRFLAKHELELIKLLQSGIDVSDAYLRLMKMHSRDAKDAMGKGTDYYVYWGEFVDRTNDNNPIGGHIKIGLTNNVVKRAKQLAGGVLAPIEFVMLGKVKCNSLKDAFYLESYAHSKNELTRYEGSEFFAYEDKREFISRLRKTIKAGMDKM